MPASGDGELTTSRGSSSHLGPRLLLLKSGPDVASGVAAREAEEPRRNSLPTPLSPLR